MGRPSWQDGRYPSRLFGGTPPPSFYLRCVRMLSALDGGGGGGEAPFAGKVRRLLHRAAVSRARLLSLAETFPTFVLCVFRG